MNFERAAVSENAGVISGVVLELFRADKSIS